MTSQTSSHTIEALQKIFSRYGLPIDLVSDNCPQIIPEEFEWFRKSYGIKHILMPTYHSQWTGLAERAVQTFKGVLRKMNSDPTDHSTLSRKISRVLMSYCLTPRSKTDFLQHNCFYQNQFAHRQHLCILALRLVLNKTNMFRKNIMIEAIPEIEPLCLMKEYQFAPTKTKNGAGEL